jgi:AraC-like DNA-binding protein
MSGELRILLERHCPGDRASTRLPRMSISRTGLSTEPVASARYPRLCVVAQGRKRVFLGGEEFFFDAAQFLLTSVNLPATSEIVQPPFLGVSLILDRTALASLLLEMPAGPEEEKDAPSGQPLAAVPVDADLLEALLHLVRLLDQPEHLPVLAPLAERELLYRLLIGPAGRSLQDWLRPTSRAAQIGRVTRLLRRQYKQPVRVEALARLAGMSAPTFYRHFRAVTTMSPIQFQKCVRLQEAHRLLLTRDQGAADVAFAVGYASRHQFSREYLRLFGVSPGQDSGGGKTAFASARRLRG